MTASLSLTLLGVAALAGIPAVNAGSLKLDSRNDILASAKSLADDLVVFYDGEKEGGTPGRLPKEYQYWESGAFMNTLIDYWHLTNDSSYNNIVTNGILNQQSEDLFKPKNTIPSYLTNDDQCFWGLAAMTAAEDEFPEPPKGKPQWVAIAKSVFDEQKSRLSEEADFCNGGLRWGISPSHHGWSQKLTSTSACLFNLGARLARYTGEKEYADTAVQLWDWIDGVGLIDHIHWTIYLGTGTTKNCTEISKIEKSLPASSLTQGAAFMYNYTNGAEEWRTRVDKLTGSTMKNFFPSGLAFEPDCETQELCVTDEYAFKGVNIRAMAVVTQIAPFTADRVLNNLTYTAKAMADGCIDASSGRKCRYYWLDMPGDISDILDKDEQEQTGVGEFMNVVSGVSNLLIRDAAPPAVAPPEVENDDKDDNGDGNSKDGKDDSLSEDSKDGAGTKDGAATTLRGSSTFSLVIFGFLATFWVV